MRAEVIPAGYVTMGDPVRRLILGEPMDHSCSKVTPQPRQGQVGTVGFMDFAVRDFPVPREGASPPLRTQDLVRERALIAYLVGIEPEQRSLAHWNLMVRYAVRLAEDGGCTSVVLSEIENSKLRSWAHKNGFLPYAWESYCAYRLP